MLFTIGHSTLPAEDFARLAREAEVTTIIDVRSHPTSKWEWFWKEKMEVWLPEMGLGYEWWPSLGGWTAKHLHLAEEMAARGVDLAVYSKGKFPKQRISQTVEDRSPSWTNVGLRDYSWFMALPEAIQGQDALLRRAADENVAICCAEVLWWKCHRSMLADFAVFRDSDAIHLQPKRTRHSGSVGNRLDRYDPAIRQAWLDALVRQS